MPEVVKSFETIPSYELMKHNTINMLMSMTEKYGKMNQMKLLGRRDMFTELGFIADVLTFYQWLRPKILDYLSRKSDEQLEGLIEMMDGYVMTPRKITTTEAIMAYAHLNYFCEMYKLTSTTIFRSTEFRDDTYHV